MLIDLTVANYGPFSAPVTLTMLASNDTHLEPSYVRSFAFEGSTKKLRLLRAAVLYGPNAAGKSSILEALSLLDALVTKGQTETTTPLDVNVFAFHSEATAQAAQLTIRFLRGQNIYRYSIQLTPDAVLHEKLERLKKPPTGSVYLTLFERKQGAERDNIELSHLEHLNLDKAQLEKLRAELQPNTTVLYTLNKKMTVHATEAKEAFLFFDKQLMGEVNPNTNLKTWVTRKISENGELGKEIAKQFKRAGIPVENFALEREPITAEEYELFKNFSEETRKNVEEVFSHRKTVFTEYNVQNRRYRLNLSKESFGTQRFYQMAGLLTQLCAAGKNPDPAEGQVLPLDELEHSLHPELIQHFWIDFLKHEGHSQIIATTHYRELLQERTLFRDDVIWFVDKNHETMSSSLYALEDVKVQAGMRASSSVYNYYSQGRLGATPKFMHSDA